MPATPKTTTADKTTIAQLFAEMDRLNERMRQDQAEIDRLKAETRTISMHTDRLLAQIEAQLDALQKVA